MVSTTAGGRPLKSAASRPGATHGGSIDLDAGAIWCRAPERGGPSSEECARGRLGEFQHTSYANITGMRERGYERMPPVEETLASYLSMGETASLKVPSLPSKPLQDTLRLNGRAYAAAGQAVALLHTMVVLQAYQADLLKAWIMVRACHLTR